MVAPLRMNETFVLYRCPPYLWSNFPSLAWGNSLAGPARVLEWGPADDHRDVGEVRRDIQPEQERAQRCDWLGGGGHFLELSNIPYLPNSCQIWSFLQLSIWVISSVVKYIPYLSTVGQYFQGRILIIAKNNIFRPCSTESFPTK